MGKTKKKKIKQNELAQNPKNTLLFISGALAILTIMLFSNTFNHDYNMDDNLVTQNHPLTKQGVSAIPTILNSPYHQDDMGYAYGYRPVVHISFAIEHELFGESVKTSHIVNTLLFALIVVLLFRLLIRWIGTNSIFIAAIITILFAVHPIHTEVVASIKNRDEILALLFALSAGLALSNYIANSKKWYWLLIAALYFSIGMLSKKGIYPLVMALPIGFVIFKSTTWKQILFATLALAIPAALVASEMQWIRMLLLIFTPVAISVSFSYVLQSIRENTWKDTLLTAYNNPKQFSYVFWVVVLVSLILQFTIAIYLTLFLGVLFLYKHKKEAIYHFGVAMLVFHLTFDSDKLSLLAIIIIALRFFSDLKNKEKNKRLLWLLVSVSIGNLFIDFFIVDQPDVGYILKIVSILTMSFIAIFNPYLSLIYLALIISVIELFFKKDGFTYFNFDILIFIFIPIVYTLNKLSVNASKFFPAILVIVFTLFGYTPGNEIFRGNYADPNDMSWVYQQYDAENQGKGEGRRLAYVENTLVAPHSGAEKFATGVAVLGEYARLHLFPKELLFYYGFEKVKTVDFTSPWVWASLLFHLGILFSIFYFFNRSPLISFGGIWYLTSILLFSNWVQLIAGMVGERLAFAASVGFCIMLAGYFQLLKKDTKKLKAGYPELILLAIVLIFGTRTVYRNLDWKDPITLMTRDMKYLENSAQANNLLALNLMMVSTTNNKIPQDQRLKMQQKAVRHFDKATQIWPYFFNAHFDKGRAAITVGDFEKAEEGFLKTIEIDPSFINPFYFLIDIYRQQNNNESYKAIAKEMVQHHSDNLDAHNFLFNGYLYNQQIDSALIALENGLEIFPDDQGLQMNYKNLLERSE